MRNSIVKQAFSIVAVAIPLMVATSPVYAAWVTDGELRLSSDYEDNVRLSSDDSEAGFSNRATGELELRQVTQNSSVSIIGGATYLDYSGIDDLDGEDIEFADVLGRWRGERSTAALRGSVRRDVTLRTVGFIRDPLDDTSPGSEDAEQGRDLGEFESDGDVDAASTEEQIRRVRTRVNPSFDYQLSERTSAQLGYNYDQLQYDDGEQVGLEDSQRHRVSLTLRRNLSELDSIRLTLGAGRFEPDVEPETDAYQATIGWERRFLESWGASIDIGANYSEAEGESGNTGFVFRARGYRTTEVGRFFGELERNLYPTSFGELSETDRVLFGYSGAISDTVDWQLSGDAYHTDSDTGDGRDYFSAGPQIWWYVTPVIALGASYSYTWVDREDSGSASGNRVGVFLSYSPEREI